MDRMVVLSPVAPANIKERPLAPRPETLQGKVVGLLWNGKPNADVVLGRIEELLRAKFELARLVSQRKQSGMAPAYEGIHKELARCHAIINGIGD